MLVYKINRDKQYFSTYDWDKLVRKVRYTAFSLYNMEIILYWWWKTPVKINWKLWDLYINWKLKTWY